MARSAPESTGAIGRQHMGRVGSQLVGQDGNPGIVGSALGVPLVDEMRVTREGERDRLPAPEWRAGFDSR